jgi:ABC-type uncharacterized transport system substrate-binding protein
MHRARRASVEASYGVDFADLLRHAAAQIDKILKGTNPGEIPSAFYPRVSTV